MTIILSCLFFYETLNIKYGYESIIYFIIFKALILEYLYDNMTEWLTAEMVQTGKNI
jgi:hypothetical protein